MGLVSIVFNMLGLKNSMAWSTLLMMKALIVNSVSYLVSSNSFSDKHINALGVLIEQPLTNWKKATEKLIAHFSSAKYHVEALEIASNFTSIMNNKTPSIRHKIDSIASQHIQQN